MECDLSGFKNESSDDNPQNIIEKKVKEKQARQIRNVKKWFNGIVTGEISEDPNSKYFRRSDRPWTIKERQQRYKDRQKEFPIKEENLVTMRSSAAERQRQYRIRRKMKLEKIRELLNFDGSNRLPDVNPELIAMDKNDDKNCSASSQALNQKRYRQKIKLLLQQYEHLIAEDFSTNSIVRKKPGLTSTERQKRYQQKRRLANKNSTDSNKLILQQNDIKKFNLTKSDLEKLSCRKKIVKLIPREDIVELLRKSTDKDNIDNNIHIQSQISPTEKKIIKLIPKDEIHKYIILESKLDGNSEIVNNKFQSNLSLQEECEINNDCAFGNISSDLNFEEDLKPSLLDSNMQSIQNLLSTPLIESKNIEQKNAMSSSTYVCETKIFKNKSGENQRNYRQRLKNKLELERLANNTVREEIIKQLQRERQRRYRERKKQAALLAKSINDSTSDSNQQCKNKEYSSKLSLINELEDSDKFIEELINFKLKTDDLLLTQEEEMEQNNHKNMPNSNEKTDCCTELQENDAITNKKIPMTPAEKMRRYRLKKQQNTANFNCKPEGNISKAAEYMRLYRQRKNLQNNKRGEMLIANDKSEDHKINENGDQNINKSCPMTAAERMRKYRLRKKFNQISPGSNDKTILVDEPQVSLQKFGKFNLNYEDGSTVVFNYKPHENEQSTIETDPLLIEGICLS